MIRLLSDIGRTTIVVAAALTIIGCIIAGYLLARSQELVAYGNFTISGGGQITPLEVFYSLLGGCVGLLLAGTVFGTIATFYDIRDNIRRIAHQYPVSGEPVDDPLTARVRREPRMG